MGKRTRVLFVQARTDFTAITMVHFLLMRYLDRETIEVHVACNPGSGQEKPFSMKALEAIPNINLRLTNFGSTIFDRSGLERAKNLVATSLSTIASLSGLIWYTKKQRIDIIHTPKKTRDVVIGVFLAKLTGAKCIVHVHQKCRDGDLLGPLERWLMKHADGIIACSQFVGQSAIEWAGCVPSKVYPIVNSLDASLWDDETDGSSIRREFGIAPDAPLLASIARLNHQKGAERLLKALALIKDEVPDVRLLFVGEGDPLDNLGQRTYTDYVKELTSELGLTKHVIFAGRRSDVQRFLAACDVFTMPSYEEGFGISFLEAMAMKKPVIGLDNGGTPEAVEHGKSGLLSPTENIPLLAENILTLIARPELRKQMGEYGRARVEEYFNPPRMAKEVEQVYTQVLGRIVSNH